MTAREAASLRLWLRYRALPKPRRAVPYEIARAKTWRAECDKRAAAALHALGGIGGKW